MRSADWELGTGKWKLQLKRAARAKRGASECPKYGRLCTVYLKKPKEALHYEGLRLLGSVRRHQSKKIISNLWSHITSKTNNSPIFTVDAWWISGKVELLRTNTRRPKLPYSVTPGALNPAREPAGPRKKTFIKGANVLFWGCQFSVCETNTWQIKY